MTTPDNAELLAALYRERMTGMPRWNVNPKHDPKVALMEAEAEVRYVRPALRIVREDEAS